MMNEKPRVLIVDDDAVPSSVLREGLSAFEYACKTAFSGDAALKKLQDTRFDVMVTDILMPGMDGFELTKKTKDLRPEMAVIVMTGFQQEES